MGTRCRQKPVKVRVRVRVQVYGSGFRVWFEGLWQGAHEPGHPVFFADHTIEEWSKFVPETATPPRLARRGVGSIDVRTAVHTAAVDVPADDYRCLYLLLDIVPDHCVDNLLGLGLD